MTLKTHLFGFMNTPVQEVGQNHKVAAWSLKVQCWLSFITWIVATVFFLFLAFFALVAGPAFGEFIESFGWFDNAGEVGAAAGAIAFMVLFFLTVAILVIGGLYLWWANTTFMKWNQVDEGAIVWANIFGAVLVLFSFGGAFNFASGQPSFSTNLVSLVIGILILVFANLANSRGELEAAAAPAENVGSA